MLENIIGFTVSFALGLASTFIVNGIKRKCKRKRDKEFVTDYLISSILEKVYLLKGTYLLIIKNIEALGLGKNTIEAFEDFNSNVLKCISYSDYYLIFNKKQKSKFTLLVEIIAIIDCLSIKLPSKMTNELFATINQHLIETKNRGNKSYAINCDFCNSEKKATIDYINGQIHSVEILEEKIMEFIKKDKQKLGMHWIGL